MNDFHPQSQQPSFRNSDKLQVLGPQEFLRQNMPPSKEGFVFEDLDLMMRFFGEKLQTDATGQFRLVEIKRFYRNHRLKKAQDYSFGLLDHMLRSADPKGQRYLGFYVITTEEEWEVAETFWVCDVPCDRDTFMKWLRKEISLPPYQFSWFRPGWAK